MKKKYEVPEFETEAMIENNVLVIYEKDTEEQTHVRLFGFGQKKAQAIMKNIDLIKKFAETGMALFVFVLISSCADRACSVYCGKERTECTVLIHKPGPENDLYWNQIDIHYDLAANEANQACRNFESDISK